MSLFSFFKARATAPVARERLQILLAHERVALGPRDLVAILRDDSDRHHRPPHRHRPGEDDGQDGPRGSVSTLEIDVEIPCDKVPVTARNAA